MWYMCEKVKAMREKIRGVGRPIEIEQTRGIIGEVTLSGAQTRVPGGKELGVFKGLKRKAEWASQRVGLDDPTQVARGQTQVCKK